MLIQCVRRASVMDEARHACQAESLDCVGNFRYEARTIAHARIPPDILVYIEYLQIAPEMFTVTAQVLLASVICKRRFPLKRLQFKRT